jgi:hypothetical protein
VQEHHLSAQPKPGHLEKIGVNLGVNLEKIGVNLGLFLMKIRYSGIFFHQNMGL